MIAESLLPEFDHEMATTRALLERVPESRADWKPHEKSMSLGELAVHLSQLPHWGTVTMAGDELDLNPPGGPGYQTPAFTSTAALLASFDEHVKAGREAIAAASDAQMTATWTLKNAGATIFALPRVAVFRSMVMNHLIHHRGQLSVYLRLHDVPLPSIYGPSADTPL
jgi:uncharacterized damage-inducible protein DinB